MTLIELFLPMYDSQGNGLEKNLKAISDELTERFGGVTAFVQSPAEGSWLKDNEVKKDEIAVYEIMVETLDKKWWRTYATTLEMNLKQKEILIRATQIERL